MERLEELAKTLPTYRINAINRLQEHDNIVESLHNILKERLRFTDQPHRFCFVLLCCSTNKIWVDAINEWSSDDAELECERTFCICSHTIHYLFYEDNTLNGNIIRVGNECIKKFGNELMKAEAKRLMKNLKYKGDKRECITCHKNVINPEKPQWMTQCMNCWKKNKAELNPNSQSELNASQIIEELRIAESMRSSTPDGKEIQRLLALGGFVPRTDEQRKVLGITAVFT